MQTANIKEWLGYWQRARMVRFDEIGSLEDMREARRFCPFMVLGRFWNVSDEALWAALHEIREDEKRAAHERECEAAAMGVLTERRAA